MTLSVHKSAVGSPVDPGVSLTEHYRKQMIKTPVVLVPSGFEFSGDSNKLLGEQAEKKVIDSIEKCGRDIPGIQTICFHGVRVIGSSPSIIREIDQCCFITYQGRRYILITEVKCNADIKKSGTTRKKAIVQLNTFIEMLGNELNVPTDNLQMHSVWPNMDPTEPCSTCQGTHPSLYEKPRACQQPGTQARANPEPSGFHIFKDKFVGNEFSKWIKGIVTDPSLAIDESVFESVMEFVARHCVGVLYDEIVKSFCILGDDQAKLVKRPEQPLSKPTIIYGLGGTGKTISIMARIQHISGNLGPSSRALFVSFEDNAIEMVKKKLEACNVDLTHVIFSNFSTFPHNLNNLTLDDDKVIPDLISDRYRYIYLDSVEDAGVDWVNKLLTKTLISGSYANRIQQGRLWPAVTNGDFWVTLDPFQGLQDTHSLHRGIGNQLQWMGNQVDSTLLEEGFKRNKFVKLQDCFRMPSAIIDHIDTEKVLPTDDLPKAQDVRSLGVKEVNINLPVGLYSSQWMADQLAEHLHTKVMERGIHPGHCAVLFDQGAEKELFPPGDGGLPHFVQRVNSNLNRMTANRTVGCMLQMSQDMGETLLYQTKTPSLPSLKLVAERSPSGSIAVEETAVYQTERHAEVFIDISQFFRLISASISRI